MLVIVNSLQRSAEVKNKFSVVKSRAAERVFDPPDKAVRKEDVQPNAVS